MWCLRQAFWGVGRWLAGCPFYKYVANRFLTLTQNILVAEYHTGYRAWSRAVLQCLPLLNCSDDFVFDSQMLLKQSPLASRLGRYPVLCYRRGGATTNYVCLRFWALVNGNDCMEATPNAQYNLAKPDSMSIRVATMMRKRMFASFMDEFTPRPSESILDIGVTSDQTYSSSNYLEALYPYKDRITAAGIDDASFLETLYPGMAFKYANALDLPFDDASFDLVHSSAVLEHVGSKANQMKMVEECLRVARRGVCITTPNRWFPIEVHTQVPLVHWLPKPWCRAIYTKTGYGFFADEANLNLATEADLHEIMRRFPSYKYSFAPARLLGWTSNLVMMVHKA
jgi:ubiquinone/menaquinone biosynthesis C-methylase UbiE